MMTTTPTTPPTSDASSSSFGCCSSSPTIVNNSNNNRGKTRTVSIASAMESEATNTTGSAAAGGGLTGSEFRLAPRHPVRSAPSSLLEAKSQSLARMSMKPPSSLNVASARPLFSLAPPSSILATATTTIGLSTTASNGNTVTPSLSCRGRKRRSTNMTMTHHSSSYSNNTAMGTSNDVTKEEQSDQHPEHPDLPPPLKMVSFENKTKQQQQQQQQPSEDSIEQHGVISPSSSTLASTHSTTTTTAAFGSANSMNHPPPRRIPILRGPAALSFSAASTPDQSNDDAASEEENNNNTNQNNNKLFSFPKPLLPPAPAGVASSSCSSSSLLDHNSIMMDIQQTPVPASSASTCSMGILDGATMTLQSLALHSPSITSTPQNHHQQSLPQFTHLDGSSPFSINTQWSNPSASSSVAGTATHYHPHHAPTTTTAAAPAMSWNLTAANNDNTNNNNKKKDALAVPGLTTPKRAALKVLSHTPSSSAATATTTASQSTSTTTTTTHPTFAAAASLPSSCERKRPPSFLNQHSRMGLPATTASNRMIFPQQNTMIHPMLALKSPRTRLDQSPNTRPAHTGGTPTVTLTATTQPPPRSNNQNASSLTSPPRIFHNNSNRLPSPAMMMATPPLHLDPPSSNRSGSEEEHSFESTPLPNVTLNPRPATLSGPRRRSPESESILNSSVHRRTSATRNPIRSLHSMTSPPLELRLPPPRSLMGPPSTIGSTSSALPVMKAAATLTTRSDHHHRLPPISVVTTAPPSTSTDTVPPVNISIMTEEGGLNLEGDEPPSASPSQKAPLTKADVSFIPLPDWKDEAENSPAEPPPSNKAMSHYTAATSMSIEASSKNNTITAGGGPTALSLLHPSAPNAPDPILDELMYGPAGHGGAELLDDESLSTGDDPADGGFLLAAPRDIQEERQQLQEDHRPAKHPCRRPNHQDKTMFQFPNAPVKPQGFQSGHANDSNPGKEEEDDDMDHLPPLPSMTKRDSFSSNRDLITPPAMQQGTSPPPLLVPHAHFH